MEHQEPVQIVDDINSHQKNNKQHRVQIKKSPLEFTHCYNKLCRKPISGNVRPISCARCTGNIYCSTSCLKLDAKRHKKEDCEMIQMALKSYETMEFSFLISNLIFFCFNEISGMDGYKFLEKISKAKYDERYKDVLRIGIEQSEEQKKKDNNSKSNNEEKSFVSEILEEQKTSVLYFLLLSCIDENR